MAATFLAETLPRKDLRATDPVPDYPGPAEETRLAPGAGGSVAAGGTADSADGDREQADGQEVGGDPGDHQQVEDLVVAEHGRHRVGSTPRVHRRPSRIDQAADDD